MQSGVYSARMLRQLLALDTHQHTRIAIDGDGGVLLGHLLREAEALELLFATTHLRRGTKSEAEAHRAGLEGLHSRRDMLEQDLPDLVQHQATGSSK